jgi:hypothetical protein
MAKRLAHMLQTVLDQLHQRHARPAAAYCLQLQHLHQAHVLLNPRDTAPPPLPWAPRVKLEAQGSPITVHMPCVKVLSWLDARHYGRVDFSLGAV